MRKSADSYVATAAGTSAFKPRNPATSPSPTLIVLDAPTSSERKEIDNANALPTDSKASKLAMMVAGFDRKIKQTQSFSDTKKLFTWTKTPSGASITAVNITSTTAKGTRLGLKVSRLPKNAILRYYANTDTQLYEITGAEINARIRDIATIDGKSSVTGMHWGHQTKSDNITLEIELPNDVSTDELEISIPFVSHLFF